MSESDDNLMIDIEDKNGEDGTHLPSTSSYSMHKPLDMFEEPMPISPHRSMTRDTEGNKSSQESSEYLNEESSGLSDGSDSESGYRCAICLGLIKGEIGSPDAAGCEHFFCVLCILEWSNTNPICPQDRRPFEKILVRQQLDGEVTNTIPVILNKEKDDDAVVENLTYCEVCGSSDREDCLLLCDGCDLGYHLDCLSPPLSQVPIEEWFCPLCIAADLPQVVGQASIYQNESKSPENRPRAIVKVKTHSKPRMIPRTRATERVLQRISQKRKKQGKRKKMQNKSNKTKKGEWDADDDDMEDGNRRRKKRCKTVQAFKRPCPFGNINDDDIDAAFNNDEYADRLLDSSVATVSKMKKQIAYETLRRSHNTPSASYKGRCSHPKVTDTTQSTTSTDVLTNILENQFVTLAKSKDISLTEGRKFTAKDGTKNMDFDVGSNTSLMSKPLPSQMKSEEDQNGFQALLDSGDGSEIDALERTSKGNPPTPTDSRNHEINHSSRHHGDTSHHYSSSRSHRSSKRYHHHHEPSSYRKSYHSSSSRYKETERLEHHHRHRRDSGKRRRQFRSRSRSVERQRGRHHYESRYRRSRSRSRSRSRERKRRDERIRHRKSPTRDKEHRSSKRSHHSSKSIISNLFGKSTVIEESVPTDSEPLTSLHTMNIPQTQEVVNGSSFYSKKLGQSSVESNFMDYTEAVSPDNPNQTMGNSSQRSSIVSTLSTSPVESKDTSQDEHFTDIDNSKCAETPYSPSDSFETAAKTERLQRLFGDDDSHSPLVCPVSPQNSLSDEWNSPSVSQQSEKKSNNWKEVTGNITPDRLSKPFPNDNDGSLSPQESQDPKSPLFVAVKKNKDSDETAPYSPSEELRFLSPSEMEIISYPSQASRNLILNSLFGKRHLQSPEAKEKGTTGRGKSSDNGKVRHVDKDDKQQKSQRKHGHHKPVEKETYDKTSISSPLDEIPHEDEQREDVNVTKNDLKDPRHTRNSSKDDEKRKTEIFSRIFGDDSDLEGSDEEPKRSISMAEIDKPSLPNSTRKQSEKKTKKEAIQRNVEVEKEKVEKMRVEVRKEMRESEEIPITRKEHPEKNITKGLQENEAKETSIHAKAKANKVILEAKVVEEAKRFLNPHYQEKEFSKEVYKEIISKCVNKVLEVECGSTIEPKKIQRLVDGYIQLYHHRNKKKTDKKSTTSQG